jgi:hypothetical protein
MSACCCDNWRKQRSRSSCRWPDAGPVVLELVGPLALSTRSTDCAVEHSTMSHWWNWSVSSCSLCWPHSTASMGCDPGCVCSALSAPDELHSSDALEHVPIGPEEDHALVARAHPWRCSTKRGLSLWRSALVLFFARSHRVGRRLFDNAKLAQFNPSSKEYPMGGCLPRLIGTSALWLMLLCSWR